MYPLKFTIEIGDLKDLREKGSFDIKMTVLRTECLNFKVRNKQTLD